MQNSRELSVNVTEARQDNGFAAAPAANLPRREKALSHLAVALASGRSADSLAAALVALRADADPLELIGVAEEFARDVPAATELVKEACYAAALPFPVLARVERFENFETSVVDTGGDAPPILLIHSMALDYRATQRVVPLLSGKRRVIAFDVRGHGLARATTMLDSMAAAADDLRQLLDRLEIPAIELVGLSMGGVLAQQFAKDFPERTSALALVCTIAKGIPAMEARADDAERDGLQSLAANTLSRWLGPEAVAANGWGVRYARECLDSCPVGHWAAAWRTLARFDNEADLGRISVPTKVIAGGADSSSSVELMQSVCEKIPNARFSVIPDAPHFVSLVNPAALAKALLD